MTKSDTDLSAVEHDESLEEVGPTEHEEVAEAPYGASGTTSEPVDLTSAHVVRETASSDLQSEENRANERRRQLYESLTEPFLRLVEESELEYGFASELDSFLHDHLRENASVTREWLNSVFNRYFRDVAVATGILRTIAHLDWAQINPEGPTMAIAALSHVNVEVREAGIRAFENWGKPEAIDILKHVRCEEPWLQEYIAQVIHDLEEELSIHAVSRENH